MLPPTKSVKLPSKEGELLFYTAAMIQTIMMTMQVMPVIAKA